MKNIMVRTNTFTRFTARLAVIVLLAALLSVTPFHAALAQTATALDLGTADSFAVLGGPAVTLTDSAVAGDVGSGLPDSTVTLTGSTVTGTVHEGDAVAVAAYADFLDAYEELAGEPYGVNLTGQPLAGQFLTPGVYSFDAAVTETGGTLTLVGSSTDTWIFKIGILGTGALTGTNFSVVMSSGETCSNNVFWWTAEAATLTDSAFIGTILAGADITVTRGTFFGNALATGEVTLTDATIAVCSGGTAPPVPSLPSYGEIKVTGGGQISVPEPNSNGRATFGFNAQPDKKGGAKGRFNYVNHVTGLHINGSVDKVVVIEENVDGSPKTVRFSGTYKGGSFIVTVEDRGEPGTNDKFGVVVIGSKYEVESIRVISNGNIQFHK